MMKVIMIDQHMMVVVMTMMMMMMMMIMIIYDSMQFDAPKGKTENVRFYTVEKIDKLSLKTLSSSLKYGILTSDYSGLCLLLFL